MGEKLKAVIQRWRQRRQHRKQRRREDPGHDVGKAVRANELEAQLRVITRRDGGWGP